MHDRDDTYATRARAHRARYDSRAHRHNGHEGLGGQRVN